MLKKGTMLRKVYLIDEIILINKENLKSSIFLREQYFLNIYLEDKTIAIFKAHF